MSIASGMAKETHAHIHDRNTITFKEPILKYDRGIAIELTDVGKY